MARDLKVDPGLTEERTAPITIEDSCVRRAPGTAVRFGMMRQGHVVSEAGFSGGNPGLVQLPRDWAKSEHHSGVTSS